MNSSIFVFERLAELEHEQWAYWTEYMLNNLTARNKAKWRKQIKTPYAKLSEKEKDSDRQWARIVWDLFNGCSICGKRLFEETQSIRYLKHGCICGQCQDELKEKRGEKK